MLPPSRISFRSPARRLELRTPAKAKQTARGRAVCGRAGCQPDRVLRSNHRPSSHLRHPGFREARPVATEAKARVSPRKAEPKPPPSREELFEYVRGRLLSLSTSDGINDNLEVAYNPDISTLTVTQPDGRCDIFLNSIDNNSAVWEIIDPSETNRPHAEVLRLTVNSISGKRAGPATTTRIRSTAAWSQIEPGCSSPFESQAPCAPPHEQDG